jgi:ankyrin repeat protein
VSDEICISTQKYGYSRFLHILQQADISRSGSDASVTVSQASVAICSALYSISKASKAISEASRVVSEASCAISEASDSEVSNTIRNASDTISKASTAIFESFNATSKASNAISKRTGAATGAFVGFAEVSSTISEAADAIFTACTTFFKTTNAMSKASHILSKAIIDSSEAFDTISKVFHAISETCNAISKASDAVLNALTKTAEASGYALYVYHHPPGWSDLPDSTKKKRFWTPKLLEAIEHEMADLALKMIECGADIDGADPESPGHGMPIKLAIEAGLTGLVESLLDLGADPNALVRDQESSKIKNFEQDNFQLGSSGALHLATFLLNRDLVTLLLKAGADVSAIDQYGLSPLHWLLYLQVGDSSTLEIARTLLHYGADPNGRTHDSNPQTALKMLPSRFSDWTPIGDILVDHGADIPWLVESPDSEFFENLDEWQDEYRIISFCRKHSRHFAGKEAQASLFTAWLNKCLVTAMNHQTISASFFFLLEGADASKAMGLPWGKDGHHADIRRDLTLHGLENGADMSSWPQGCKDLVFPSLQVAILRGHLEEASLLLSRNARVDHFPRWGMLSPLHMIAAKSGSRQMMKRLIAAGADIHAYEMSKFWPLGPEEICGANQLKVDLPKAIVKVGEGLMHGSLRICAFIATPIQAAAFRHRSEITEILREAGADINAPPAEKFGFTALQLAIFGGGGEQRQCGTCLTPVLTSTHHQRRRSASPRFNAQFLRKVRSLRRNSWILELIFTLQQRERLDVRHSRQPE